MLELHTGNIACQYLTVGLGDNGGGVRITSVLVLSFIFALGLLGKLCNFGGSCGKGCQSAGNINFIVGTFFFK